MRRYQRRIQFDGSAIGGCRFVIEVLATQSYRQVMISGRIVAQHRRQAQLFGRFLDAAYIQQRAAESMVGIAVARIEPDRLAKGCDCQRRPAGFDQPSAALPMPLSRFFAVSAAPDCRDLQRLAGRGKFAETSRPPRAES